MPSSEYRAIQALRQPARSRPGDMWLNRRLGIVRVFNGHKRGSRRGTVYNNFHLYHWGKPAMWCRPADWRDDDPNAGASDPALGQQARDEVWEYIGNIFDLLPYSALTSQPYKEITP